MCPIFFGRLDMLVGGGMLKAKETTKRVSFKTDEAPDAKEIEGGAEAEERKEKENEEEEEEEEEEENESRKESVHEDPDVSATGNY